MEATEAIGRLQRGYREATRSLQRVFKEAVGRDVECCMSKCHLT